MEPRTTASAWLSLACRSPSRPSTASRTRTLTSWVRVGSAVWFSNGRTATVLTDGGSPPPANPYRHPPRASRLRLARNPDLRRKVGRCGGEERKVEPGRDTRHDQARGERRAGGVEGGFRAPDHFPRAPHRRDEPAGATGGAHVLHRVGSARVLPARGGARGDAAQGDTVLRQAGDAEHRPHQRVVRHHLLDRIGWLGPERPVADDRGGACPGPEGSRHVEAHRVRRRDARTAPPAGTRLLIAKEPLEAVEA